MKKLFILTFFTFGAAISGMAEVRAVSEVRAVAAVSSIPAVRAQDIRIQTDRTEIVLRVGVDGVLRQSWMGARLAGDADLALLPAGREAYIAQGGADYYTPAMRVVHTDGNPSLLLRYVSHDVTEADGAKITTIKLKDPKYPLEVSLIYTAWADDDVISARTEIVHRERRPVTLYNYASSMIHLDASEYWLTSFSGDWAREVNMSEQKLDFGRKTLDSRLGTRANLHCSPMFVLGLDGRAKEESGAVMLGTLAWTGNFAFDFEVDHAGKLRLTAGINPASSEYMLDSSGSFATPEFIFTLSADGTGRASRNLHAWARRHRLKDGLGDRMTLLNNWEATYFDFDEAKLSAIMDDAVTLGVDMFLLDDGWFGNKYPRGGDTQGLGDWTETTSKLPGGIRKLTEIAAGKGVNFGLWIEPEMVNPKSELYEKHRDWVVRLPNRDEYYFRNQLVLDLSNPAVQDFVFGVVDRLMTENPGIAYFKWDCNSPLTNVYSSWLKERQSHIYVDFVRGLYSVLDRIKAKYPALPMMLCSGGGGRTDYGALRYFTEFWPSDNTDPLERIFIQWGYSHFFPAKATAAHVTSWNKTTSVKFRTDVAMMGRLGFDIMIDDLRPDELEFCQAAVRTYNGLKNVILDGDQYRLVSPYEGQHAAVMYVGSDSARAVVFAYDLNPRFGEPVRAVRLRGLDPRATYTVREINLELGAAPRRLIASDDTVSGAAGSAASDVAPTNQIVATGEFLMTRGLDLFTADRAHSTVLELVRQ